MEQKNNKYYSYISEYYAANPTKFEKRKNNLKPVLYLGLAVVGAVLALFPGLLPLAGWLVRTAGIIYCLCLGALCRQSRKKCCILSLCSLTAHNLIHYLICLVISQIAFFHNLYNSFLNHIESSLSIIINYVTANLKFPAKQL